MYSSTGSRAAQACATCRKQKRKCDKTLPSCSRCSSLQRACDYSDPASPAVAPSASAEAFASLQMKLAEIEARLDSARANQPLNTTNANGTPGSSTYVGSESSPESAGAQQQGPGTVRPRGELWVDGRASSEKTKFPAVMFLDSDVYKWAGASRPNPNIDIPMVSPLSWKHRCHDMVNALQPVPESNVHLGARVTPSRSIGYMRRRRPRRENGGTRSTLRPPEHRLLLDSSPVLASA